MEAEGGEKRERGGEGGRGGYSHDMGFTSADRKLLVQKVSSTHEVHLRRCSDNADAGKRYGRERECEIGLAG